MHAQPEGLAFAVADSQQSAASAITIDASRDLEISPCTTSLRLLVAAGFAMTLLSAALAFDWWDGLGDYDTIIGFAGVVVFALMTIRLIWMLPAERGAVVVVTPTASAISASAMNFCCGIRLRRFRLRRAAATTSSC